MGDYIGRSPGSRVFAQPRLPITQRDSGILGLRYPLTVAGAAAALHCVPFSSDAVTSEPK